MARIGVDKAVYLISIPEGRDKERYKRDLQFADY